MLDDWIDEVLSELDLTDDIDVDNLLLVARDVAHAVERRAAPVTTYLLGLAVARGISLEDAASRVRGLAQER
ncbi:MAG: DUF6457 domain-containing protein [Actinomycetota bacterium]|nr:DUF6457 domain-containing protein [Actinomycetota bacterium]